jgi:hypothetical protein
MKTNILIENATKELLKQLGRKSQTYDEVISELIDTKTKRDSLDSRFEPLPSSESRTK